MNDNQAKCICTPQGYSPECPETFYQGGRMLHAIEVELKPEPRIFAATKELISRKPLAIEDNELPNLIPGNSGEPRVPDIAYEDVENCFPENLSKRVVPTRINGRTEMVDSEALVESRRDVLRRFEALNISGKSLTDISIGGYTVDLTKAAQKASAVAPLPPAKLPKIYIDSDMNFLHHFFQGLERLVGREKILSIVNQERYYTTEDLVLLPLIEDIIKIGYERKDTNLTVFTKSVLSSTFECDEKAGSDQEERGLLVAANLWGFQYIECGMELKEADLRMWLSVSYSHFRTLYFNTFKDSGVPAFALEGVQTRYEAIFPRVKRSITEPVESQRYDDFTIEEPERRSHRHSDAVSRTSRRTRRSHRHEQTLGSILFGNRN